MNFKIPVLDHYEWQKAVLDKDLSSPPPNPDKGNRYIIAYNPSGAWHNKPKRIAECINTSPIEWDFTEPKEGMLTLVQDEGILYQYVNNKWKDFALIIGKKRISSNIENLTLHTDECGKVFTADSTSMVVFNLPSVTGSDVGVHYTFARINVGGIKIQAADNDTIAESYPGGSIKSDDIDQAYTTLTLLLVSYNRWVIISGHGTWSYT